MPVYHDKEALLGVVNTLPRKMWEDGILIDCPKDRRRRQARGEKPVRFTVPMSVGKRFAIQIERYLAIFKSKEVAWDVMTTTIEGPSNELLEGVRDGTGDVGKDVHVHE